MDVFGDIVTEPVVYALRAAGVATEPEEVRALLTGVWDQYYARRGSLNDTRAPWA